MKDARVDREKQIASAILRHAHRGMETCDGGCGQSDAGVVYGQMQSLKRINRVFDGSCHGRVRASSLRLSVRHHHRCASCGPHFAGHCTNPGATASDQLDLVPELVLAVHVHSTETVRLTLCRWALNASTLNALDTGQPPCNPDF